LTPLSEVTSSHRSTFSEITADQPTPGSSSAMPARKTFETPARQLSSQSKSELSGESSVRNVSNVSLEQWLQGPSPPHSRNDKGNNEADNKAVGTHGCEEGKGDTPSRNADSSDFPNGNLPLFALDSGPPQEVVAGSFQRNVRQKDGTVGMKHFESAAGALSQGGERGLSEEERFILDYGEFDNDLSNVNHHGEYNYLDYVANSNSVNSIHDETTGLLGAARSGHEFYSGDRAPDPEAVATTMSAGAAPTPPRAKLKRGNRNSSPSQRTS